MDKFKNKLESFNLKPLSYSLKSKKSQSLQSSRWIEVNQWEAKWWGLSHNERWDVEVEKQKAYANLIGLPEDLQIEGRILDIGCGPISMLLRVKSTPSLLRNVGVDPIPISEKTKKIYINAGIKFLNIKAEDINPYSPLFSKGFDEIWIYNCLQHVDDPNRIFYNISKIDTNNIRIFEWINLPPCQGHPNTLTESMFVSWLPDWKRKIWTTNIIWNTEYIAIWLKKYE